MITIYDFNNPTDKVLLEFSELRNKKKNMWGRNVKTTIYGEDIIEDTGNKKFNGDIILQEVEQSQIETIEQWWELKKTLVVIDQYGQTYGGLKIITNDFPIEEEYDVDGLLFFKGTIPVRS